MLRKQLVASRDEQYPIDSQNAIFNFLFVLASEYQKEMPYDAAVEKACDWIISLGTHVKAKAVEFNEQMAQQKKDFINPDK
jgi:hypothetical protein